MKYFNHQVVQMCFPELSVSCRRQEVPDVSCRMEPDHDLIVEQHHLGLIFAEHHIVGPSS